MKFYNHIIAIILTCFALLSVTHGSSSKEHAELVEDESRRQGRQAGSDATDGISPHLRYSRDEEHRDLAFSSCSFRPCLGEAWCTGACADKGKPWCTGYTCKSPISCTYTVSPTVLFPNSDLTLTYEIANESESSVTLTEMDVVVFVNDEKTGRIEQLFGSLCPEPTGPLAPGETYTCTESLNNGPSSFALPGQKVDEKMVVKGLSEYGSVKCTDRISVIGVALG